VVDFDDLGDEARLEQVPHREGVAFGAAEAERIGQLSSQRLPELLLLVVRQLYQRVVEELQPLILLGNFGI
jgi:hypothetical protein